MPPLLLVVDDTPALDLIVQRLGKRAGQDVVYRANAEAAWEYLNAERDGRLPDLLLLDLNLPGMSGWELCRRLRETASLAALRIALFSHWDRPQDIARGLEAGADFVVSKDLLTDPDAWRRRVAEILEPPEPRPAPLPTPDLETRVRQINQALRGQAARLIGAEVVGVLLRQSLERASVASQTWLAPDGLGLEPKHVIAEATPEVLNTIASALADGAWRLLGADAGEPLLRALQPA